MPHSTKITTLPLLLAILLAAPTTAPRAQEKPDTQAAPMAALDGLTRGAWHAEGQGFTSTLVYRWRFEGRLLEVTNELTNPAGETLARYVGSYAWDPGANGIVFWTMAESGELHRGRATWRAGVLWHEATVTGGRITSYASALRWEGDRMEYFADYAATRAAAELLEREPLVYRRVDG